MGRTALILGSGIGRICAAQSVGKALPRDDRVVLADRLEQHVFQASLPWVLGGTRSVARFSPLMSGVTKAGIEFIRGEVTGISADVRRAK